MLRHRACFDNFVAAVPCRYLLSVLLVSCSQASTPAFVACSTKSAEKAWKGFTRDVTIAGVEAWARLPVCPGSETDYTVVLSIVLPTEAVLEVNGGFLFVARDPCMRVCSKQLHFWFHKI